MQKIHNRNGFIYVSCFFFVGLLLIVSGCQATSDLVVSLPATSTSLPATATWTPSPTLTALPTSTPVKVLPSTPTPRPTKQLDPDAAFIEQLFAKGVANIVLLPEVAEIMLTDSQGRRVDYDPMVGEEVNDFFDGKLNFSGYSSSSDGPFYREILLLPLEAWGTTITVTITGIEEGEYELLATFSEGMDVVGPFVYTGTITAGQVKTITMGIPKTVTEFASPPDVQVGPDMSSKVGQPLTFVGSFTDINPNDTYQISWDFGDGGSAINSLTTTHTYEAPGIYTVTLTIAELFGFAISDTLQVIVK